MATSEVAKYSVYDPRIVQTKPKYAVEKGALAVTNVSFNAQTANTNTQQFNVIVPSENVFIDRAVDWSVDCVVKVDVTFGTTSVARSSTTTPILTPNEISLAAFPNHQLVSQMTATINDATVTVNTSDVMSQILRLTDMSAHRRQRTCPTMLDVYALNADTPSNSPLLGYAVRHNVDELPNGAWSQWWFATASGAPATALPIVPATATASGASSGFSAELYIRWRSTEKLLLPPFLFGDAFEKSSTGLFGVQNFQVQCNLQSSPARAIRIAQLTTARQSAVGAITAATVSYVTSGFTNAPYPVVPTLSVQFLTPALDVPLPPKSIVPYMEFPRYITTNLAAIASTRGTVETSLRSQVAGSQLQSNTITLPNIPDLLMIYAKPATPGATVFSTAPTGAAGLTWNSLIGDFTLPIQNISVNFDNFSGLLSSHTQAQLYKMSVENGLEMDFASWSGEARQSAGTASTAVPYVSTVGGPLVLKPGKDFPLQAGQAPGLVGNFSLQFTLSVGNQFDQQIAAGGVQLYVVPISSGFFETIKGSSRIVKGVLTEQDILSAGARAPGEDLERKVGSALPSSLKNLGKKAAQKACSAMDAYM